MLRHKYQTPAGTPRQQFLGNIHSLEVATAKVILRWGALEGESRAASVVDHLNEACMSAPTKSLRVRYEIADPMITCGRSIRSSNERWSYCAK
jgi:hypothetical protein